MNELLREKYQNCEWTKNQQERNPGFRINIKYTLLTASVNVDTFPKI